MICLGLWIVASLLGTVLSSCRITPLQVDRTEFGTERLVCQYEYNSGENTTSKLLIKQGSMFEPLDSCVKCRCTQYGLECCATSFIKQYVTTPPQGCKVITDGCDEFLVMEDNNNTDCFTGMTIQQMRVQNRMQRRMEDYLTQWSRQQLGLIPPDPTMGEGGPGGERPESDFGPLMELRLLDMLFGGSTGHAEPLATQVPPPILRTLVPGRSIAVSSIGKNQENITNSTGVQSGLEMTGQDYGVTPIPGVDSTTGAPRADLEGTSMTDSNGAPVPALDAGRIPLVALKRLSMFRRGMALGGASNIDIQGQEMFKPRGSGLLDYLIFSNLFNK